MANESTNPIDPHVDGYARAAIVGVGAAVPCPLHPEELINTGDEDKDDRSFAEATTALKLAEENHLRKETMKAVRDMLDGRVYSCPQCGWEPKQI